MIDVPLLGCTVIEQNGDGCLEDSLMPVGWPLHLDGAVKQRCLHRTTTLSELDELLQAYDMNFEFRVGKTSSLMIRRSPCMGSAAVLATVSSSNQVRRKDLTPMAVLQNHPGWNNTFMWLTFHAT